MSVTLFELVPASAPDVPRCRMCPRPARWIPAHGEFSAYCTGRNCTNNVRLCQVCGAMFERNVGAAGTKYCSTDCKVAGYRPSSTAYSATCSWCGHKPRHRQRRGGIWPYVCPTCLEPIKHVLGRLREHRVPIDMVRVLLTDSGCAVCHRDILTPAPAATTGRLQAPLVVDHDHGCCPRAKSCGRCVRGFLCGTCNSAAGLVRDDPEVAFSLGHYLSATRSAERVA